MEFAQSVKDYLGVGSKKEVERLSELVATQERLLDDNNIKPTTKASSLSRETRSVEDAQGLVKKRISTKELQLLYLNNQFIFRGVNVRADELSTRGYKIVDGDETGRNKCEELIKASGGTNLCWQLSVNTDNAGDGYLEHVLNKNENDIKLLRHVNSINFGFLTDEKTGKIILGDDETPKSYMQLVTDDDGKEERKPVDKTRISHLKFNTIGDEFNGVSSLQPVYNTAIRLMNMEHAAAEAAVKTANPTWVVETVSKSPQDLYKWMNVLGRVSAKDVVFLPDKVKTELKSPGNQNFNEYADYFLNAVVSCLGVPKSILTGSSDGGGGRSTVLALSKHFYSVIRTNQRYMEEMFNSIFEKYGEMSNFDPPKFKFNDIAEDADRNGQRAGELFNFGLITLEEARTMIGLETSKSVEEKLENNNNTVEKSKFDPDADQKKADAKAWHPSSGMSPEGSQKDNKTKQKADTDVESVR